jgi:hypothetical protein
MRIENPDEQKKLVYRGSGRVGIKIQQIFRTIDIGIPAE